MTVQELYKRFLLMVNKDDTNAGINISPAYFVLLYNAETLRWIDEQLKKDSDNIDSNYIEFLFMADFQVEQVEINKQLKFIDFQLPSDYFQVYGSYSLADRGPCKGVTIWNFERKPGDTIAVRLDENSKASFDYQEAPFILGQNLIRIYYDDYKIKETFINYYRTPVNIDIEGYTHFDGTSSSNVNPELDDYNTLQILARVAEEVNRQTENTEGLQISRDRTNTEK